MIKDSKEKQTDDVILATALKRASSLMGISNSSLAKILKIDTNTLSRIFENGINPDSQRGHASTLIVRIYKSLSQLSGNDNNYIQHFLFSENRYFRNKPINVMETIDGLILINKYLDTMTSQS